LSWRAVSVIRFTVDSRGVSHRSLEGGRTDLAEGRMPTPLLIEHFDVIEQLHLRVAIAGELEGRRLAGLRSSSIAVSG
jgi:hypothetical protein